MSDRNVKLEVCVDSVDGLNAAIAGGADRIELCSALDVGGLTPGPGLMQAAADALIECHAMIRPRPGDFIVTSSDRQAMLADVAAARQMGLKGVVLGASYADTTLDDVTLQILVDASGAMEKTLHRVFDLTADPSAALDTAVALGFTRILTSGQASSAPQGAAVLESLVKQAAGRIQIMAGGGVTVGSVPQLLSTGLDAIHASCSALGSAKMDCSLIGIGQRRVTDEALVARFKAQLSST